MAALNPLTPTGHRTQAVRIEKPTLVADGQGGHTITGWILRAVVWALVEPLSSRETQQAKVLAGVLNVALTIPYRSDLTLTDRILVGARVLHVTSYQDPTGRKIELRVLCSETQDAPLKTPPPLVPAWVQGDWVQ